MTPNMENRRAAAAAATTMAEQRRADRRRDQQADFEARPAVQLGRALDAVGLARWRVSWPDGRFVAFIERCDDPRSGAIVSTRSGWEIDWADGATDIVATTDIDAAVAEIVAALEAAPVGAH